MELVGCSAGRIPLKSAVTTTTGSGNGFGSGGPSTGTGSGFGTTTGGAPTSPIPSPPGTPPPNPILPVPTAPAAPAVASVVNFGDSITCGYLATPQNGTGYVWSLSSYAGLFDAQLGVPSYNLCRSGDEAEDMSRMWVYAITPPAMGLNQLVTMLIGTNDMIQCGSNPLCVQDWEATTSGSLAWLTMPPQDKIQATQMNQTAGQWTQDTAFKMGEATTTSGSTLSFTVNQAVAGRSLYLGYRVFAPWSVQNGTATISVDGVQVGTMTSLPFTGLWIATSNGVYDTVFLDTVPLGAVGPHKVTVQLTSGDGTFFSLLWAGVPSQNYADVAGAPRVIIGYPPNTASAAMNAGLANYNAALTTMVQSLTNDGMYITIAPTANVLDPATDFNPDGIHPNDGGHVKLAAAFASVL
jgi:lysophospholipase L1-like esterase